MNHLRRPSPLGSRSPDSRWLMHMRRLRQVASKLAIVGPAPQVLEFFVRILYVMTDADIGGAEAMVETQAHARRPGDSLELAVLLGPGSMSARLEAAFDHVHYFGFSESSRDLPGMVRQLEQLVRRLRPDVVHSHLFHADLVTLLARTGRIPKVSTIHTQGFGPQDHPLTKLIARAVGFGSFRFAAVVPTGETCADFGRRYRYRNLVESVENSAVIPAEPLFHLSSRTFLSLARWHPVKGHDVLFRAFRKVRDEHSEWKLVCVGPGVDLANETAVETVRAAGLEDALLSGDVRLAGSTDDVSSILASASALIISSLYGETFPVVGVEANAAGIPVITTDVGQSSRFAYSSNYVVKPNDPDDLARAMLQYIACTDDERLLMSKSARQRAESDFTPDKAAAKYRKIYTRAIQQINRTSTS